MFSSLYEMNVKNNKYLRKLTMSLRIAQICKKNI